MQGTCRFSVKSATIRGSEAIPVTVEVIVSSGMPGLSIVGMPDTAIYEAKERVRAALKSCNFKVPGEKIVFNLAPGSVKKTGSGFDLPIAVALLAATGQIPVDRLSNAMLVGELSLDGEVKPVNGLVAYQMCASREGLDLICSSKSEVVLQSGEQSVYCVSHLRSFLEDDFSTATYNHQASEEKEIDYSDVGGHRLAKRALQIAAAGNLGLLMMGPPGSGKTMLAMRLPTILPKLTQQEIAESASVASIVGEPIEALIHGTRPFRSPHHSATLAGLIGGGNPVRPGEVSLAHNGVLMLDELSEFSHSVLQGLRQPIEDKKVSITRADGNVVMPANFMLIAASNPCPCGYYGDEKITCKCALPKVVSYQNRIGGPLIDRFDMCIDVWRSDFDEVISGDKELSSYELLQGVMAAREFSFMRYKGSARGRSENAVHALLEQCDMNTETKKYFKHLSNSYVLSGRGIMRILRVARTIADIEQQSEVTQDHLAEAFTLRMRSSAQAGQHAVGA